MKEAIGTRVGQTIHMHTYGRLSVFHIPYMPKYMFAGQKECMQEYKLTTLLCI